MIKHAVQLAKALDAEDYEAAATHLAPGCTYEFRNRVIRGRRAIIDSYRASGKSARARFDTVRYESAISQIGARRVRIDYTDMLALAGRTHAHRCAQEVSLDEDGLISHIRHIDVEGEGEALRRFARVRDDTNSRPS